MKRNIVLAFLITFVVSLFGQIAFGQCVRLDIEGEHSGKGTAFCIGKTAEGSGVYLTAKHNLRGAERIRIKVFGKWYQGVCINQHPTEDVASFEAPVIVQAFSLGSSEPTGELVRISGFGPEYYGREACSFFGVIDDGSVLGERGLHPIPGDSGAPVVSGENVVVGVISGYDTPYQRTSFRSEYADQRLRTRYTGVIKIRECLQQCYQSCPSGGCRIWIRQEYRQPIGFLGFPSGPVQRVPIAESVPRVFVPEDQSPRPVPDPISVRGPQGSAGKDGRSVTQEEVEAAVSAWLDANRDSIRGPAGTGVDPKQVEQIVIQWLEANRSQINSETSDLKSRVSALEKRPLKVVITEDGKIKDQEDYLPGEAVVFDLARLRGK